MPARLRCDRSRDKIPTDKSLKGRPSCDLHAKYYCNGYVCGNKRQLQKDTAATDWVATVQCLA